MILLTTRLCDQLLLADNLQTMKQLAIEKCLPALTAGASTNHLEITYCPTGATS